MKSLGRILIADDDEAFRRSANSALTQAGYECHQAQDGGEAIGLISTTQYDLLLSDVEMPGNRDLCLARDVSRLAPGLPVVLVTAFPTVETAVQSVHLSVTGYLVKPFHMAELLDCTMRAIWNYRARKTAEVNHLRIAEWNRVLEELKAALQTTRNADASLWLTLFDLTLRNIGGTLLDLKALAEAIAGAPPPGVGAKWGDAAGPVVLVQALRETISVLEKTRSSFRSKELGELRKKLEDLLETGSRRDSAGN